MLGTGPGRDSLDAGGWYSTARRVGAPAHLVCWFHDGPDSVPATEAEVIGYNTVGRWYPLATERKTVVCGVAMSSGPGEVCPCNYTGPPCSPPAAAYARHSPLTATACSLLCLSRCPSLSRSASFTFAFIDWTSAA